jgi:hypothetical protein
LSKQFLLLCCIYFIQEDLYFSKISTCIENEGIAGLLLNKLHYLGDSLKIGIDREETLPSKASPLTKPDAINDDDSPYVNQTIELNMKEFCEFHKTNGIELKNMKLCSDLNKFKFIGWKADSNVNYF